MLSNVNFLLFLYSIRHINQLKALPEKPLHTSPCQKCKYKLSYEFVSLFLALEIKNNPNSKIIDSIKTYISQDYVITHFSFFNSLAK